MFNEDEELLQERLRERIAYELSKVPVKINRSRLENAHNDLNYVRNLKKDLEKEDTSRRLKREEISAKAKLEYKKSWADEDIKRLEDKIKKGESKLNKSLENYNDRKNRYEMTLKKEDVDMFYDEEELLEAVDILVEDYGIDEDEAIDMIMEKFDPLIDGSKVAIGVGSAYAVGKIGKKVYQGYKYKNSTPAGKIRYHAEKRRKKKDKRDRQRKIAKKMNMRY